MAPRHLLLYIIEEFHKNLFVPGNSNNLNSELEEAGRVRDFIEFGELLCRDALAREESCGGHFREEYQTDEGEAKRNDKDFANASVWKFNDNKEPLLFQEELNFDGSDCELIRGPPPDGARRGHRALPGA